MKELSEVLQDWEAVIGLEIHTELTALDTKMFCNCKLSHDDEPNANVCPVCLGLPGALPVPNKRAIESIVKAGLATNCEIQRHSMFYRKHYFYPDMAKNFQTTQGPVAFAMYGHLDLDVTGRGAAERPDCAFGEAEAQSLASASANAEGLSTSMTSTMREGNQRAGHLEIRDSGVLDGGVLPAGPLHSHRAGGHHHVAGAHVQVDAAAGAHPDEGIRADVVQLLHGDGGRRAADAGGADGDLLAEQRAGVDVELTVLCDMDGVIKELGDGLAPAGIAGQDAVAADVALYAMNMKLFFKLLHDKQTPF